MPLARILAAAAENTKPPSTPKIPEKLLASPRSKLNPARLTAAERPRGGDAKMGHPSSKPAQRLVEDKHLGMGCAEP